MKYCLAQNDDNYLHKEYTDILLVANLIHLSLISSENESGMLGEKLQTHCFNENCPKKCS